MMISPESCYVILELSPSCTLADVRKAYRRKAKVMHPDVNKAPGAHEQFIQLREAYEYLVDIKSGKLTNPSSPAAGNTATNAWTEQRKEETRERARQYAEMRYREFRKSGHDKYYAFEIGVDLGQFIFSLLMGIALIIALTVNMGAPGFFIGAFVAVIIGVFSYRNFRSHDLGPRRVFEILSPMLKRRVLYAILLFVLNVVIFLVIGCSTLIQAGSMLLAYLGSGILTLVTVVILGRKRGFELRFYPLCVGPAIISLFLCLNYFFSSRPVVERYRFWKEMQYVSGMRYSRETGGMQESTTIILENNQYDEFVPIRTFVFYDEIRNRNYINYVVEEGLFGFRVVKSYTLL